MKRLFTARPWLTSVIAVVVVGGASGWYLLARGSEPSSAASGTTTTRLVSVSSGTITQSVSTTGTFTPADEEDVSFGSSATITSVRVEQGDKVAKGDVLGTISTVTLKATLAEARADLATAQSNLATAQDSSDTSDAQLAASEAAVTSAKSAVTDAQEAIADATLVSPVAGTVAEVNVAAGDQSSGSSSSGSSSAQTGGGANTGAASPTTTASTSTSTDFVVIGMKKWQVSATVDDTQVGLIAKGDQVQLNTDNSTGTIFGTVSSVSVLSSSDSGAASYPVEISVTGTPTGLHDGASATASIIYKQVANVLTVPTTAVHVDGSTSYVYVDKDGTKAKATITTGLASGGTTQIRSGLTSGQQVYVESAVPTRSGNSNSGNQQQGQVPGGGEGNFPAGGNFPGGGAGFPGGGSNP